MMDLYVIIHIGDERYSDSIERVVGTRALFRKFLEHYLKNPVRIVPLNCVRLFGG